ncbi:phage tail tip fiber protein [Pseudomonas carnis]|uniref:phage tail tip fiber protein n=1 Tax=Pseudomonas carnis TaxID=2487355 RepID=UPI001F07B9EB|nr:DUF1983 domain-containing protein [Pseudomonas carnis]
MSDPQLNALLCQVNAISAQIQTEANARIMADEVLSHRVGIVEEAIKTAGEGGAIQSSNYVPGVSGWKLNPGGDFEFNSCTLGSAAQAAERQMVSVEVASWSKYDLPKNAANLLQFMQAELERVPEQYRHAAEFEEFDASYGDESFNARLFLSYSRLETEEELADRLAKGKIAGARIVREGGCTTMIHDGVVRWRVGNLDAPPPEPEQPQPFKVDGDKVYLNEEFIDDGSVTKSKIGAGFYVRTPGVYVDADGRLRVKRDDASSDEGLDSKLAANWSLKMQVNASGQYVAAGIGLGLSSEFAVSADRFAINDRSDSDTLRDIAGKIGETNLAQVLKEQADLLGSSLADQVKAVIRKELMPGGLLHRSR